MLHDFVFLESQTPTQPAATWIAAVFRFTSTAALRANSRIAAINVRSRSAWPQRTLATAPQANRRGRAPRASSWNG